MCREEKKEKDVNIMLSDCDIHSGRISYLSPSGMNQNCINAMFVGIQFILCFNKLRCVCARMFGTQSRYVTWENALFEISSRT
mmetsp:Transcript_11318/g.19331  ORF Transcript_11318/g.19331 Transcript_11318/m.19331 type:complete len:83 (+) Transcript_11318:463-711(+)